VGRSEFAKVVVKVVVFSIRLEKNAPSRRGIFIVDVEGHFEGKFPGCCF
jgi:hypothetical protein